jgi:hypothetical protein
MANDGQEVQLKGILESLSNRFWSGWGFGVLVTDEGSVKITGALEGHVAGTSLIVRGQYKESPYGRQLDCSSIVVDSVSGDMSVIRAWARKSCREHEAEVVRVTRNLEAAERWPLLADATSLAAVEMAEDVARKISVLAASYLLLIATKKGLMEKGFTDNEAEAMFRAYGERVEAVLEEDPYGIVIDRILSFSRVDVVVAGRIVRNDPRRLHAAQVQALVASLRNGHTAVSPKGVEREAAEIAGVYVDAIRTAGRPRSQIYEYDGKLQLRGYAYAEQDIATWVVEAMKLEV